MNATRSAAADRAGARWVLLALIVGSFGVGTTEFIVMGLLPDLAQDLLPQRWRTDQEGAIAQAGWVITLYAAGAVVGAPIIAGAVAKYPRRRVMIVLTIALTAGNALTLLLPTFELVAASRFLAALPHGAYFGIGALVAADVLGPGKRAKGAALVLVGLTLANVVGVPLGTYLGQAFGWRAAFSVVVAIFAVAAVAIALTAPTSEGDPTRTLRAELGVFRIGQVWLTLGVGMIGFGGLFSVYSYIAPVITEVAGAPRMAISVILALLGLGMTCGNLVGGHLADINLRLTLYGGLVAISATQVVLALSAHHIVPVGALAFAVGFFSSALAPTIQARLMEVAGDNQSIAAALNHSALNSGNAVGAALGGAAINMGLGYVAPMWVGAMLALTGFGIASISYLVEQRTVPMSGPLGSEQNRTEAWRA